MSAKGLLPRTQSALKEDDSRAAPQAKPNKVAIIGSGGAAFAAANRLQEEGVEVTIVERDTTRGACVNVGCVPSKILISATHVAHVHTSSPFDSSSTARRDFGTITRRSLERMTVRRRQGFSGGPVAAC